jgi:hypothetical protein
MVGAARKFQRRLGERRYRKMFVLATEGTITEPQYFTLFNSQVSIVYVNCLRAKHDSSPPLVLKRMEAYLKAKGLGKTDQAWLVVDKDQWTDAQLEVLGKWAKKHANYGMALSNPRFEYWLLLHFEDGNKVTSSSCDKRLRKYLPDYDKGIDIRKISVDMINDAIIRAKKRDTPPCTDWPNTTGSTVYRLVENILKTE